MLDGASADTEHDLCASDITLNVVRAVCHLVAFYYMHAQVVFSHATQMDRVSTGIWCQLRAASPHATVTFSFACRIRPRANSVLPKPPLPEVPSKPLWRGRWHPPPACRDRYTPWPAFSWLALHQNQLRAQPEKFMQSERRPLWLTVAGRV